MTDVYTNTSTGKSPGPNGYAVEFYIRLWDTIEEEFGYGQ
jgi:hypothetical protein